MPNDAKSEFLVNRAMGGWAERIFAASIRKSQPGWQVTHYGDSDNKAAGDDGFKEFYLGLLEEVRKYGKRPDLLIFAKALNIPEDISQLTRKETDPLVTDAIGALEVRSSKFEYLRYKAAREQDSAAGKSGGRETLNFTVKVEDLKIVYRWIERTNKPQAYVQVFLRYRIDDQRSDHFSNHCFRRRIQNQETEEEPREDREDNDNDPSRTRRTDWAF